MTKRHFLLAPFLLGGLLAANLSAATISGTFSLNARVVVGTSSITWQAASGDLDAFDMSNGTGLFAPLTPTLASVQQIIHAYTLTSVGTVPDFLFIEFPTNNPAGSNHVPNLILTTVVPGTSGSDECDDPPAAGQTCTPANPPFGSPFNLENFASLFIPGGFDSVAKFQLAGVTEGVPGTWAGIFSASFIGLSFQDVLFDLGTTGFVGPQPLEATFGATVTFPDNPIPEPGTFALIGIGLIMATVAAKRLKKA